MTDILRSINRVPFEWVEIDQSLCANQYGSSPCVAVLGTTGPDRCYNTRASCQDPTNYDGSDTLTLRFCHNRGVIPDDYQYFPYLTSASVSAASINPGGGNDSVSALGTRATITCSFSDHPSTDLLVDPYLIQRDFDPYTRGTFWSKWRARNPYYMHRVLRHKSAYIDPTTGHPDPATLITRTFFITAFSGPDSDGNVQIQAKDVLTLAANEKAKAPFASTGKLSASITDSDMSFTLIPSGIGNAEYPASGKIRIDSEIVSFTRSGDAVTITARGENNTTAVAHDINATAQLCLEYGTGSPAGDSPDDILYDLLTTYAGVDAAYLDTVQWADEVSNFLPRLYSAIIAEPTGVTELIAEMCEQMYFTCYWDERAALLKMRAVRPVSGEDVTSLDDDANLLEDSVQWTDEPDQLITQVWVYYAQKNPTDSTKDARNFAALDVIADTNAESTDRNGVSKIKTIYSRWMTGSDGAAAVELGEKILDRYNQIPRHVMFSLDAKDRDLWLADFISISNRQNVDIYGNVKPLQMQVVKAQEQLQGTAYTYSAIEYSGDFEISAPDEFTIAISTDHVNLNLRELFDSKYAYTPVSGDKIRFTVRSGVTIGSACYDSRTTIDLSQTALASAFYTAQMRYYDWDFGGGGRLRTWPLPYLSRHTIVADADYSYSSGTPDIYVDPYTGTPTAYYVGCDIKERPAKAALVTGSWPAGVELYLDVEAGAKIVGEGGAGGSHMIYKSNGLALSNRSNAYAGDGGHALEITHAITINNQGFIAGGGGGGDLNYLISQDIDANIGIIVGDSLAGTRAETIFIPGAGGAGFIGSETAAPFVYNSNNSDYDLSTPPFAISAATGGSNSSAGAFGIWQTNAVITGGGSYVRVTAISGPGGALGGAGGNGWTEVTNRTGSLFVIPRYNTQSKAGRAGFLVKDGMELITWTQRGFTRGAEY